VGLLDGRAERLRVGLAIVDGEERVDQFENVVGTVSLELGGRSAVVPDGHGRHLDGELARELLRLAEDLEAHGGE